MALWEQGLPRKIRAVEAALAEFQPQQPIGVPPSSSSSSPSSTPSSSGADPTLLIERLSEQLKRLRNKRRDYSDFLCFDLLREELEKEGRQECTGIQRMGEGMAKEEAWKSRGEAREEQSREKFNPSVYPHVPIPSNKRDELTFPQTTLHGAHQEIEAKPTPTWYLSVVPHRHTLHVPH